MKRRKHPAHIKPVVRELHKALKKLRAMKHKKKILPAQRKAIDLQIKALKRCHFMLECNIFPC